MKLLKWKNSKVDWMAILSLMIAFFSCVWAIWSRLAADFSNKTSDRMLQIEENRKLNENKDRSLNLVNALYDKIMYNFDLYDLYKKAQNGSLMGNESFFYRFINEFEWLGVRYCQEQVYLVDLKSIKSLFSVVCKNDIIVKKVEKESRNAFSKICLDLLVWEENNGIGRYFNQTKDCRVLK